MNKLIQHLSKTRKASRLWFEELALYEQPEVTKHIRTIPFRRGLNIIWAREPDEESTSSGFHASGHGVGKSSLCLLMRFCLGDNAKALDRLLDEVSSELGLGGVAAVIHIGEEVFSVFRYFKREKGGFVAPGANINELLQTKGTQSFKDFETMLSNTLMANVTPKEIPETGQPILWGHILAWLARDQGARFMEFFHWREREGSKLQRPKKDPPIVMRATLGLMGENEAELLKHIETLEIEEKAVLKNIDELLNEPNLIKKRIEAQLRTWLGVAQTLPMQTDDLFMNSVNNEIGKMKINALNILQKLETEDAENTEQIAQLRAEQIRLKKEADILDAKFQQYQNALSSNEGRLKKLSEDREELQGLVSDCKYGEVLFQECKHINIRLNSISLREIGDKKATMQENTDFANNATYYKNKRTELDEPIDKIGKQLAQARRNAQILKEKIKIANFDVERDKGLLEELAQWGKITDSPDGDERIKQARIAHEKKKKEIVKAISALEEIKNERSEREKSLSNLTDMLAEALFANEARGALVLRDETKPFRISLRGGEAYRVLEVLLGDLVCLLDSTAPASSFPGLLIHDCPREADMGPHPYREYLRLVESIDRDAYSHNAPFQYVITTTTPPPESMRKEPYLVQILDPSCDDGLLFKRRFKAFSRQENLTEIEEW